MSFFVRINNRDGPVDVWAVAGIGEEQLMTADTGFSYFPAPIPRSQISLVSGQDRSKHGGNVSPPSAR